MNNKARIDNSIRNITFGILNQLVILIISFISRTIFIKILGAEYLGINGLFTNVLTLLSLADLGIGSAMAYSFYKPVAENNTKKLSALTNFYKKIYNGIAIFIAIIGILITPIIHNIVKTESMVNNLEIYYLLFLVNTVISYLYVYKSSIIIADQKAYIVSKYSLITKIINMILQIIVLITTKNYIYYLLVVIITTLLNNILLSKKANKMYPFIKQKEDLAKEEKKEILKNIKSVFIYKISSVLLNGTDNIIISIIVGTIWVGYYSNYSMIINSVVGFTGIIFSSLYASIGNLVATSEYKKRIEIFNIICLLGFFISTFTTVCFYQLIGDFITMWIGKEYVFDIYILIAILLNNYLSFVLQPIWSFREATGIFNKTKYVMLICAIINIVLSIILGYFIGIAGILLASAISRLITYFWYEPIILFKEYLKADVKLYFKKQFKNFLVTIICLVITILCTYMIKEVNVINFILKAIISVVVPIIIYFILYRKTAEYKYIFNNIIKKYISQILNKNSKEG